MSDAQHAAQCQPRYQHFTVALMTTVSDVIRMCEQPAWRDAGLLQLQRSMHIDKVYVEAFRSSQRATREQLESVRDFFATHGIATAGALTTSAATTPQWDFESLCMSNPEHRDALRDASVLAAQVFGEVILDDFFFTNCTCERCEDAKGERTWSQHRLHVMEDAARNLVVGPAHEANPDARMIIKYPNWYEDFDASGYNLELGVTVFDGAHTGTETRDQEFTQQHLPPYLSYGVMRYYDRLFPGRNGGGWVDPFQRRDLDRYAEQIRLTLLAKPREMTLFCWGALVDWSTEFDTSPTPANWVAPIAGNVLRDADAVVGELGEPIGAPAYRPLRASGEANLHHHLGTAGVPIEMRPDFPAATDRDAGGALLLTAGAAADPALVSKMRARLRAGGDIVITSGLVRALQDRGGLGLASLVDVRLTGASSQVTSFFTGEDAFPSAPVSLPQVTFPTNVATPVVHAMRGESGYPLLSRVPYGDGLLYVLAVPDTPADLYRLPREVLGEVRRVLSGRPDRGGLPVRLEGAGRIGLFLYDNDVCVVHSFLPHPTKVTLVVADARATAVDLRTGRSLEAATLGGHTHVPLQLHPGTYEVVRIRR